MAKGRKDGNSDAHFIAFAGNLMSRAHKCMEAMEIRLIGASKMDFNCYLTKVT